MLPAAGTATLAVSHAGPPIPPSMSLQTLRPMLWTADVRGTVDFYVQQLGFTCGEFREEWGWAALQRDDVEIMASRPNDHVPFDGPRFTGSFYIVTDRVDALWEEFRGKAKVCYPLEDFFYGMREFAIYDNNGYLLQFGQPLDGD